MSTQDRRRDYAGRGADLIAERNRPPAPRQRALDLLARREHSRLELARKLRQKGCEDAEIRQIVEDLAQEGWLSDARFAESYLRVRLEKGYGPSRIQGELRDRGVAVELIAELMDTCGVDWVAQAEKARRKRFGPVPPGSFRTHAQQARFLQQRGFSLEQIGAALRAGDHFEHME
jgi:regulatory protein